VLNRKIWTDPAHRFFKVSIPGVFRDTFKQMQQAQLPMVASSLAYTTILSIVPLLAVSFAIFKAFGGMQKLYAILEPIILARLAQGTNEEAVSILHRLIDNTQAAAIGIGGLIGLIFTSMSMLSSFEKAINLVWQAKITRGIFQRIAAYWLFITLGPLALSVAVGVATSSNFPLHYLFPSGTGMFLISVGIFFCIYKWVPQTYVKWRCALISSLFTASIWNIASDAYTFYAKKIVTYSAIYGSLGAIPIFLLWIYILWLIVLTGAALTAALQKRAGQLIK
jgi:membrane protein